MQNCTGAPAALRSDPTEAAGGEELQAEAVAVPFAGQGGIATPAADVDFLFSQNQSKLKALQVSSDALLGPCKLLCLWFLCPALPVWAM